MPARDKYHEIVKTALIKDGWKVTDDPLTIKLGSADLFVDLGAEKLFAAEKDGEKIAVEIKSFLSKSIMADIQDAIGQFIVYREVLADLQPNRILFLAIEEEIFYNSFSEAVKDLILKRLHIKTIIFNVGSEEIVKWIS